MLSIFDCVMFKQGIDCRARVEGLVKKKEAEAGESGPGRFNRPL